MGQAASSFDYGFGDESDEDWLTGAADRPSRASSSLSSLAVSIFADKGYLRAEMAEDAAAAGLRIAQTSDLANLLETDGKPTLGDLVLVDCPVIDGAELAALSRLDMRAAKHGSHLVVSTSMNSLDDVFGCLDQSNAQILVMPSRADRVIALGRVLTRSGNRVRELSEEDRLSLLRLTEQVSQIAHKLEQISSHATPVDPPPAFRFEQPAGSCATKADARSDLAYENGSDRLVRAARPPLPDPRLVRRIIRQRQLRARFFEGDLFADPAWDMLLDLTAARVEHVRVSVTSLCIASGVPPTTALRWIGQMTDSGLLQRVDDETDRRRAFITLTDKAADAMARYFAELGAHSATMV
ncbi:winged helix DNA-binding protein [Novosphingobium sp. FKTRR1]|uniref:winged helix DNA-binding protein n=1 Tax=Novosphingobium sp. FKTRR1 TaxID=2879118 RepID=UPI001CEFF990|nr:winged helix DNA-binding protein [Novosphingobium sp. FKTRR1]